MSSLFTRNRNEGKLTAEGKKKAPNWEYRFDIATIEGKRKQKSKSGFKTKADAIREGTKALAEYNNSGVAFEPSKVSYADYLDYWIDNYCKFNIADSTMVGYKNIVDNHIKPRLGHYMLKSLTTLAIQKEINDIYVNRGFTKSFMKNILKVVKGSLKYAKNTAHLINDNPAIDVTLPKIQDSQNLGKGESNEDIIVLNKNDVSRILERFKKSKYQYVAMLTAYYTGLRVSEVYGLTWDCIDFDNKTLTVNKISKKIEKPPTGISKGKYERGKALNKWYLGSCKTDSSYRTINIGDTLINELKAYKQWQEANKKEYGEFYTYYYAKEETTPNYRKVQRLIPFSNIGIEIPLNKVDLIFVKENGEYHGTESMRYPSKVANYELGIRFNFHAFRHTHATMLIEANTPIKAVSKRLGHSSVRTTLETYVHVTKKMNIETANTFENIGELAEPQESKKVIDIRDKKNA